MPRQPTWEDWLRDPSLCERSMRYFERPRGSLIKILPERIAKIEFNRVNLQRF